MKMKLNKNEFTRYLQRHHVIFKVQSYSASGLINWTNAIFSDLCHCAPIKLYNSETLNDEKRDYAISKFGDFFILEITKL